MPKRFKAAYLDCGCGYNEETGDIFRVCGNPAICQDPFADTQGWDRFTPIPTPANGSKPSKPQVQVCTTDGCYHVVRLRYAAQGHCTTHPCNSPHCVR